MTTLEKIADLTWFDLINKLKRLFLSLTETMAGTVQTITGTLVDNTDPQNPVINSPVSQTITNGETETSPSEDVLFDALALKADLVGGTVPANQLPSYVDDVLEGTYINTTTFNDLLSVPYSPETSKIYVDTTSNLTYRWGGSSYIEISTSQIHTLDQVLETGSVSDHSFQLINGATSTIGQGITGYVLTEPTKITVQSDTTNKVEITQTGVAITGNPSAFKSTIQASNITGSDKVIEVPDASGTIALTSDITISPLSTIDEGNGNGIVRTGRTVANYGNVGLNAIDLSFSDVASITNGATGLRSFSEGYLNTSSGINSHSEGEGTTSSGQATHAEGYLSSATVLGAHSEGFQSTASGIGAHSEGFQSTASARASHAEGEATTASAVKSHAGGFGAVSNKYAEWSRSSAGTIGQYGVIDFAGITTDATISERFLGNETNERFTIESGSAYSVKLTAIAIDTATKDVKEFTGNGLIKNVAGTTSLVGTITMVAGNLDASMTTATITVTADNTNDSLKVETTGILATTIDWYIKVDYIKVK